MERYDTSIGYLRGNICFICQELNTGDKSKMNSLYKKSGSIGWNKDKFDYIKKSTLLFNNYYK